MLRGVLDIVIEALGASSGDISLLNPDTGKLELEVAERLDDEADEDLALRLGQGLTGWVAFHGRPLLIPDVTKDPRYVKVRANVRSEMVTPMISGGGQILGVINVDGDRVNAFSTDDLALMSRLCDETTAVMERFWELRNLRIKARQLESLMGIGQNLVTKLEPQELFNTITRDSREISSLRACALYLHDTKSRTARLVSYDGPAPDSLPEGNMPLSECLIGSTIKTQKAVEFSNVQSAEFIDVIDLPREASLRSMISTPLRIEEEIIGVLMVFSDRIHRFNNDEKRLLSALASLGAVALQNSRLYARVFQSEATLRKNEQLTTLGLLASEIAHEIRNPLTVLKLLFGTLKLEFPDGDPRRTDTRVITEKLDQLEAIVSRVLNFAKAPTNLHSRWSVTDIIEDTLVLIRLKLTQGKIHLQFSPSDRSLMVNVHKGQLQQVVLNLLLNATQAMPDGGKIEITCDTEHHDGTGDFLRLDINDTGPGIRENMREHIFDSFLTGRPDGTGLGLAIAKRIMASHHGDIYLKQTGPTGTTISLTLPLV